MSRGQLQRRGQLEHPFNWVLVLFAGAFFLLMFVLIIRNVMDTNKGVSALHELTRFETMIDVSQANLGANNSYEFTDVVTTCDTLFSARLNEQILQFPGRAIFTPSGLDGRVMIWSQQFSLGSPVTTITTLVPEETLFLIVGGSPVEIIGHLRGNVKSKVVDPSALSDRISGYKTVVVVNAMQATGFSLEGVQLSTNAEVHGVDISYATAATLLESGGLTYYRYDDGFVKDGDQLNYLSSALFFAGIVAGTAERFTCGRAIVENHMRFMAKLNEERLRIITTNTNLDSMCYPLYTEAMQAYHDLTLAQFQGGTNILLLKEKMATIFRVNQALGRNGCPLIY